MISVKNVSKSYGNVKAVDDFSFNIKSGEIVGFIGPNGAGKTTMISMLCGITNQDVGNIVINGFDLSKNALDAKKTIGFISDSPDAFLRLKGIEYLNFIADIYDISPDKRKERIEKYAASFDLYEHLSSRILSYSHGMRQKLMIVGALIHDPDVWLLDEPLIGLDPKSAYILKEMMKNHAAKGKCVFFSTHVLEVAEKLCTRIIMIGCGKKLYDGSLENLQEKYPSKTLEEIFILVTENEHH